MQQPSIITVQNPEPLAQPFTYTLQINRSGMRQGNHIKERLKSKYLQHYKDKLNIKSIVRVRPPGIDNLARLTTKQLDDYIQLERNRAKLLIHKRTHTQPQFTTQHDLDTARFTHTKIFRSSFLSKLNKIVGEQHHQQQKNQEYTQINYFFNDLPIRKHAKSQKWGGRRLKFSEEEEDTTVDKSVASVEDSLVGVEQQKDISSQEPQRGERRKREKTTDKKFVEWFDGMSRKLLKRQPVKPDPILRGMDMDKHMSRSMNSKFRIKPYGF